MKLKKICLVLFSMLFVLSSCTTNANRGKPQFMYNSEPEWGKHEFIEYYETAEGGMHHLKKIKSDPGQHLNSYYDGKKFYVSTGYSLFIYDSETQKLKELSGYTSNAIKKINDEIWLALDIGFAEEGYASKLCKLEQDVEINCVFDVKNQQVTDFYINFEDQVFFAAGAGLGKEPGDKHDQYKVAKYDMRTGEATSVHNDGKQIIAGRLTQICPGQFITSDADIYTETGEKIGEVIGTKGRKLKDQINDIPMNTTAFLDYDNNLVEIYGCENDKTTHLKTITLDYQPNIYPGYHSWEAADNGEISMPIDSDKEGAIFDSIGIQSVNLRTGEVYVVLFDEPVTWLRGIARFE